MLVLYCHEWLIRQGFCYIYIYIYIYQIRDSQGGGNIILADAMQLADRKLWKQYSPTVVVTAVGRDHSGFSYPERGTISITITTTIIITIAFTKTIIIIMVITIFIITIYYYY